MDSGKNIVEKIYIDIVEKKDILEKNVLKKTYRDSGKKWKKQIVKKKVEKKQIAKKNRECEKKLYSEIQ